MKPLQLFVTILSASALLSTSLYADRGYERGGGGRGYHHERMSYEGGGHRNNWVIPLVVGSVIGYALSSPQRESVTYVQNVQAPVVYAPEPMYQEQWVYFGNCDCQRKVLVQIR
ncbi:MAG: hypothetical protein NT103_01430 [Campylobacterales bacterium]|nr:hypothetical protein [Campylobacterales bacterium]